MTAENTMALLSRHDRAALAQLEALGAAALVARAWGHVCGREDFLRLVALCAEDHRAFLETSKGRRLVEERDDIIATFGDFVSITALVSWFPKWAQLGPRPSGAVVGDGVKILCSEMQEFGVFVRKGEGFEIRQGRL